MRFTAIIREKWEKSKWWPVFFWSLLIFLGSTLPPVRVTPDTLLDFIIHKSVHLFEYFVLALVAWRTVRQFSFSLLYPILYAISDEGHQLLVGGRQGRWQDILWDSAAVILGNLCILYLRRLKMPKGAGFGKEGVSSSIEETHRLAGEILLHLGRGNFIALYGGLGSGKTVFVQGLAQALGVRETVNSPSFVLVREYLLPKGTRRFKKLIHVDLYRLASSSEVQALLLEELVADKSNLVVVEWAERWEHLPAKKAVEIYLSYVDGGQRRWRWQAG